MTRGADGGEQLGQRAQANARRLVDSLRGQEQELRRMQPQQREGIEALGAAAGAAERVARLLERASSGHIGKSIMTENVSSEGGTENSSRHSISSGAIVARADFQYRWRVYAFVLLLFGYGVWSLYDGYVSWPRQNEIWRQMPKPPALHSDLSIGINRVLGIGLPAIALVSFVWLMYRSRGQYKLSSDTLEAPGHPPVALASIQALDKSRWDRKGIAVVEYQAGAGMRKILLRDMVYERRATDQIVRQIEAHLSGASVAADEARP